MERSDCYDKLLSSNNKQSDLFVVRDAAIELDSLRKRQKYDEIVFPHHCRRLLQSIAGNSFCVDCGSRNPTWASVSFGTLICMMCSGRHRSYGVQTSFVRSIDMDTWNHSQILAMLEGGNNQLHAFFERHKMSSNSCPHRYQTKAAKFYREHLRQHVHHVAVNGTYQGRDANRSRNHATTDNKNNNATQSSNQMFPTKSGDCNSTVASTTDEEMSDSSSHSTSTIESQYRSFSAEVECVSYKPCQSYCL
jgi:Putative GTPase activating protein for Arf